MKRHTRGPWALHADGVLVLSAKPNRQAIADVAVSGSPNLTAADHRANARLIAAAPDLLSALKAYVAAEERVARTSFSEWQRNGRGRRWRRVFNDAVWKRNDPVGWPLVVAARAAIAKAEGRS